MTKHPRSGPNISSFDHSSLIRHSTFVIRIFIESLHTNDLDGAFLGGLYDFRGMRLIVALGDRADDAAGRLDIENFGAVILAQATNDAAVDDENPGDRGRVRNGG